MTSSERLDRRVRRSRAAIRDAFVALVLEMEYDAVTVELIVQRADVARATFYAHYHDKRHLLDSIIDELATGLMRRLQPSIARTKVTRGAVILEMCKHAAEHRDLYRVAFAQGGQAHTNYNRAIAAATEPAWQELATAGGVTPRLPLTAIVRAWAGAHVALMEWWLTEQPHLTPQQIALMDISLLHRGFPWALGFDPNQIQLDPSLFVSATPGD